MVGMPAAAAASSWADSENVDFYVTFDNYEVGVNQANSLLYGLGLLDENFEPADDAPEEPLSIELLAGSRADNTAHRCRAGAVDTLPPNLAAAPPVAPSGQMDIDQ